VLTIIAVAASKLNKWRRKRLRKGLKNYFKMLRQIGSSLPTLDRLNTIDPATRQKAMTQKRRAKWAELPVKLHVGLSV
jgi:hypothetical protein